VTKLINLNGSLVSFGDASSSHVRCESVYFESSTWGTRLFIPMSTHELRRRVAFRNSMHPDGAATKLGLFLAATLMVAGCKADDAAPATANPPKVAQPVVHPPAVPIPPATGPAPVPVDVAAPPADAVKTASGLAMKTITPGSGSERVAPGKIFVCSFSNWDRAGNPLGHMEHAEITTNSLAPGWEEAIVLMAPGETRRLWIPASLTRKPNTTDTRPVIDITVDLTLEYLGRLKMGVQGATGVLRGEPVQQASTPSEPAPSAPAGSIKSTNGKTATPASATPKKQ
jgi:hypothetical protein